MYTSCTSACSVATGPPSLDTGQRGEVAKIHPGDPQWEMLIFIQMRNMKGPAEDSDRAKHVGIPLCLQLTSASLVVDHGPYCGVRVGEASHPGPSGGAARATDRRREEREHAGDDGDALGLTSILRPLIEKLLREVLRDLLGGGGMKQLVAGLLVGEQPAMRRSSTASPPDGDEAMDEDYRKGARWKKRRRRDEAAGAVSQAQDGEKAAGKGRNEGGEKAAGKGKNAGGEKAVGKGKHAAGDGVGKGKGGGEVQPPKGRGRGADEGGAVKGKGKSTGDKPTDDDDGGWQEVPGRQWSLRAGDWTDPVMKYDEVVKAFASEGTDAVKAVVLATPEQRETLRTLLRGTARTHAVLIVTPDKEAAQKCPGVCGGRVIYRTVAVHESFTAELAKPQPKAMAAKVKLEQQASTVIYIRYHQRYMATERWKEVQHNPQKDFHAFMALHRMKALDSWGWQVEDAPKSPHKKIFGCARVQEGDVHSLLALSGKGGVFFDVSRSYAMPACYTEWHDQAESESSVEYLRRMLTLPADFGLVAGSRQLGKRLKRAEGQAIQRHWLIDGVPREVTADQLRTILQEAGFDNVEMLVQRRRATLMEFHFRAKATFTTDCIGIPFQLGDSEFALWARIAPARRGGGKPQNISTAGSWSLAPPKSRWSTEQVALRMGMTRRLPRRRRSWCLTRAPRPRMPA